MTFKKELSIKTLDKVQSFTLVVMCNALVLPRPSGGISSSLNEPDTETEANEFLKFIKHSEYSIVEQLHKLPAKISLLTLMLHSEPHRKAMLKVLK